MSNNVCRSKDSIVLVGAGKGGHAILETLLKIPSSNVKCVCELTPNAPGVVLAKENNIPVCEHCSFPVIDGNKEIDLIFEVTGDEEVFKRIQGIKAENTALVGAAGTKIIFHLLDEQNQAQEKLREYQKGLEAKIHHFSVEVQSIPEGKTTFSICSGPDKILR